MSYSKQIKEAAIKMMLPPNNKSMANIRKATNIPMATLRKWQDELRKNGHAAPAVETQSEQWSSQDKFLIVVVTLNMNEAELSEYCRQKGLYPNQVKEWQENCQQANGVSSVNLVETMHREKALEKELKHVKKELQRKEAALSETAALLVLSKKQKRSGENTKMKANQRLRSRRNHKAGRRSSQ